MSNRVLIDTNILIYAYDVRYPGKQQLALEFLHEHIVTGRGVMTSQVLAEFYVAVTQKIAAPLSKDTRRCKASIISHAALK